MKSLEDLERAFQIGLLEWEENIVKKQAQKMSMKIVREVRRKTNAPTGNLRRRWFGRVEKQKGQIIIYICNDTEYASWVNDGHRIVRGGKTIGMAKGRHMLENGIEIYKKTYLKEDIEEMLDKLRGAMK